MVCGLVAVRCEMRLRCKSGCFHVDSRLARLERDQIPEPFLRRLTQKFLDKRRLKRLRTLARRLVAATLCATPSRGMRRV